MIDVTHITRDSVLTLDELAKALKCSRRKAQSMDLPYFMAGARQRFIWGAVLDVLNERSKRCT